MRFEVQGIQELKKKMKRMPERYKKQAMTQIMLPAAKMLRSEMRSDYKSLDKKTGEGKTLKSIGIKRRSANLNRDFHGMSIGVRYDSKYDGNKSGAHKGLTVPAKASIKAFGSQDREHRTGKATGRVTGEGDFIHESFEKNRGRAERIVAGGMEKFTQKELNKI